MNIRFVSRDEINTDSLAKRGRKAMPKAPKVAGKRGRPSKLKTEAQMAEYAAKALFGEFVNQ